MDPQTNTADTPIHIHLPTEAKIGDVDKDVSPEVVASVNRVGRAVLYSFTFLAIMLSLTGLAAMLWLIPPMSSVVWYITMLKVLLTITFFAGIVFLIIMFPVQRFAVPPRSFMYEPLSDVKVHIAFTSYNDEEAIVGTVKEFKACPEVNKVIVVDNNSSDNSIEAAREAGADHVVTEKTQGYGACCQRCLKEASEGLEDHDIMILCEGDMTFSATDVKKFIAYIEHCDMVLGTRTTQELRDTNTQMDPMMNMGNQLVAKLVQLRFWETRLTDVGCTYRAIRAGAYRKLSANLTDNGMMLDFQMTLEAMKHRMRVIEVPIVFRERVGESKGVGKDKIKAFLATLDVLKMLYRA